jgi:hypothetical protein
MKESPDRQRLEEVLRSSKLVAGGFLGTDNRTVAEIIEDDTARLSQLGYTTEKIANRMREITRAAIEGLGTWVNIDEKRRAKIDEAKGSLPCPWPHPPKFAKRVTTLERKDTGQSVSYSDLNVHMIAEHAFFEGKGSRFRLDPEKLTQILF